MKRLWIIPLVLSLAASAAIADGESPQRLFDRIYGPRVEHLDMSPGSKEPAEFARQLLNDANTSAGPDELRELMLRKAYDYSINATDGYATALQSMQSLGRLNPARGHECEDKILYAMEQHALLTRGPEKHGAADQYIAQTLAYADQAVADERYDHAYALYERARQSSQYYQGRKVAARIGAMVRSAEAHQKVTERVAQLRAKVEKDADYQKPACELARMLVIEQDKPAAAVELLASAADPTLSRVVPLAAQDPAKLTETQAKELGDWYFSQIHLATIGRAVTAAHARTCYNRFLALHPARDPLFLEVQTSLQSIDQEMNRPAVVDAPRG